MPKTTPKSEPIIPVFNPFNPAKTPSLSTEFNVNEDQQPRELVTPTPDIEVVEESGVFDEAAFHAIMSGQGLGNRADAPPPRTSSKNPFAAPPPPPKVEKPAPEVIVRPDDTPRWSDFAAFIAKHGKHIINARYPFPFGDCVDTMWRGVPVLHGETAEVRHITEGWISWELASSEK